MTKRLLRTLRVVQTYFIHIFIHKFNLLFTNKIAYFAHTHDARARKSILFINNYYQLKHRQANGRRF